MSLNEKQIARFIARHRTETAESSVQDIDRFIKYHEDRIVELKKARSKNADTAQHEEERYQELLAQDIVEQLYDIQGVESIEITPSGCMKVLIRAYYLYNTKIYNAGVWYLIIPMANREHDTYHTFCECTLLPNEDLFKIILAEPTKGFGHPYFVPGCLDDCFNYPFAIKEEINRHIMAGEFVSALQIISFCLYNIRDDCVSSIPTRFDEDKDADVYDLAEFFDLSEKDIGRILTKRCESERLNVDD